MQLMRTGIIALLIAGLPAVAALAANGTRCEALYVVGTELWMTSGPAREASRDGE